MISIAIYFEVLLQVYLQYMFYEMKAKINFSIN